MVLDAREPRGNPVEHSSEQHDKTHRSLPRPALLPTPRPFLLFEGAKDPETHAQRGGGGCKRLDALHGNCTRAGGELGGREGGKVPADGKELPANLLTF